MTTQTRKLDRLPVSVNEFFDDQAETQQFARVMFQYGVEGFKKGVKQGSSQGGGKIAPDDIFTAAMKQALQEQSYTHAAQAVGTTKEKLAALLQTAHEEGQSVQQFAKTLRDSFDVQTRPRSLTIARTELTRTINDGTTRALDAEGFSDKEWSTVIDGRERETHGEADGQVVAIDGVFSVGGHPCNAPGDDSLPPEEAINCRCTVLGAGLTDARKLAFGRMFLRTHGSLERAYVVSLVRSFGKQRDRVLSQFPS